MHTFWIDQNESWILLFINEIALITIDYFVWKDNTMKTQSADSAQRKC